jgi:hypothetical protein
MFPIWDYRGQVIAVRRAAHSKAATQATRTPNTSTRPKARCSTRAAFFTHGTWRGPKWDGAKALSSPKVTWMPSRCTRPVSATPSQRSEQRSPRSTSRRWRASRLKPFTFASMATQRECGPHCAARRFLPPTICRCGRGACRARMIPDTFHSQARRDRFQQRLARGQVAVALSV